MKQILIVDDEKRVRRLYDVMLTQMGYKTYKAADAIDANEILKREKIDLVLLDLTMPAAGGDELYEVIRLFHQDVKVIVSSVLPVATQQKMIRGAAAYYDKSQSIAGLFGEIRKVCETEAQGMDRAC